MEDDQNGRRPKWKTTKMEDDQNGKTKIEDDKNGRQQKWKTTKMEDEQNEDYQNGSKEELSWGIFKGSGCFISSLCKIF